MGRYDVIIVGAGMAGSAAAWRLSSACRVLLLEQLDFLHVFGSSHGSSRIFRHAYEDARYVELAVAAGDGWRELEHDASESLLHRTGGLDLATHEQDVLAATAKALGDAGQTFTWLGPDELHRRFPHVRIGRDGRALHQQDAGILPATRCLAAMLRVAASRGAELRARENVESIQPGGGGVEVRTSVGRYTAGQVIVCGGPWLGRLTAELRLPLTIEQQQVLYLHVADAAPMARPGAPIFIEHDSGVYGFPIFELPDAIKVARHGGGATLGRPEDRTAELDKALADEAVRGARAVMPGLSDTILRHETCLYTCTPDSNFILDRHPHHDAVLLAGGFSGHGFKFAPAIGAILADLAVRDASGHNIQRFRADRFSL